MPFAAPVAARQSFALSQVARSPTAAARLRASLSPQTSPSRRASLAGSCSRRRRSRDAIDVAAQEQIARVPLLKLWFRERGDAHSWGENFDVVRAATRADTLRLLNLSPDTRESVTELSPRGPEAVLWSYEDSPDSRDRD
jgi:hypothetical protein